MSSSGVQDNVVEMRLSQAVNVTDTGRIREAVRRRIEAERLGGPPVELVDFNVFICCTTGTGAHMVDFADYKMEPGTAIWIRPGQVQQWSERQAGFDAEVTVFSSSSIPDLPLFQHLDGATPVTDLGEDAQRTLELIRWIRSDLDDYQDLATAAAAVSVVLRIFARNVGIHPSSFTPRRELVHAFVESIEGNIEQRSVSWHSRNIGASTRSVARATIEVLKLRPKEVIADHVILEARRRLAWSKDDIATVSRSLRFSEPSNFTKFFRAHTGQSPLAFREGVAALDLPG